MAAVAAYGPCVVQANVGEAGAPITLMVETDYPFAEVIRCQIKATEAVQFPLWLRIPGWLAGTAQVQINNELAESITTRGYHVINRIWQPNDQVTLTLPMPVCAVTRNRNASLVIALAARVGLENG